MGCAGGWVSWPFDLFHKVPCFGETSGFGASEAAAACWAWICKVKAAQGSEGSGGDYCRGPVIRVLDDVLEFCLKLHGKSLLVLADLLPCCNGLGWGPYLLPRRRAPHVKSAFVGLSPWPEQDITISQRAQTHTLFGSKTSAQRGLPTPSYPSNGWCHAVSV